MTDNTPYTNRDIYWGKENDSLRLLQGTILLPNNYAVSFEQINPPPIGQQNPPDHAEFSVQTLKPWFTKESGNNTLTEEHLVASEMREIAHLYPELEFGKTLQDGQTLDQLVALINHINELDRLMYDDTNPHKYIREANVLARNPEQVTLTQDGKIPINQATGEPDPRLLPTGNFAFLNHDRF